MGLGMQLIPGTSSSARSWPTRVPRDPLRQPRRRAVDQDRRAGAADRARDGGLPNRLAVPADRHGRPTLRPARRARHRASPRDGRVDGRHDRPDDGDQQSRAGALAHVDHVDDRRAPRGHAEAARLEPADAARAARPRGLPGLLRAHVPHHRVARVPPGRGARARARRGHVRPRAPPRGHRRQLAAILASGDRTPRSSSCRSRRRSSTAPTTR